MPSFVVARGSSTSPFNIPLGEYIANLALAHFLYAKPKGDRKVKQSRALLSLVVFSYCDNLLDVTLGKGRYFPLLHPDGVNVFNMWKLKLVNIKPGDLHIKKFTG